MSLIHIYCNESISRLSWVLVGDIEPKVQQNVNDSLDDYESCDIILRFNVLHVELKWKRSMGVHLCIYSSSSLCAIVCARVCVLILASRRTAWWRAITFLLVQLQCSGCGTQLPSLPEHRWNRTLKTPLLPYTSVPPSLPLHPSLPPLDLCLRPSVSNFIFLSLDSLFFTPSLLGGGSLHSPEEL